MEKTLNSNTQHKSSMLLTENENDEIFRLLGQKCYTVATTVIQMYSTDGPEGVDWIKRDVGVLCLVRDTNRRSYFFKLFCLLENEVIWEHEVYNNMKYLAPTSFLHTFESEDSIVAFNFADESEAAHLRGILLAKLEMKGIRRNENKFEKKCITKADIGPPQNFLHISHVSWDPNTGFELGNVNESTRQFLDKAGISEKDLKDEKTRDFIYDFIEKHGGLHAVTRDIDKHIPPPTTQGPLRSAPPPPRPPNMHRTHHPSPPPPPSVPPPSNVLIDSAYVRAKEPQYTVIEPTAPISMVIMNDDQAPPPSSPMAPPPMPTNTPLPPPLPPHNGVSNEVADTRSTLMEAVRGGTTLKHVGTTEPNIDDPRSDLLRKILEGVSLKVVPKGTKSARGTSSEHDLVDALRLALEERKNALHSDSSDGEETRGTSDAEDE